MLRLGDTEKALLAGEGGEGPAFAMRILEAFGRAAGAARFIEISRAHVDGCLYHGQASLDFVERFVAGGTRVAVPTTLNVGSVDLIHPELFDGPAHVGAAGKRLMEAHLELGCTPSFTCAPYQTLFRPAFGEHVAWAESNAIVFANSVIGARTARYGDFVDLCAAVTGLVPETGLHITANRRGTVLIRLRPGASRDTGTLSVAAGLIAGKIAGSGVPVIEGLPADTGEDDLKALGAAAATTGGIGMFHAVGLTPEAPDLDHAFQGRPPRRTVEIGESEIVQALAALASVPDGAPISAVALGTPHFSLSEFAALNMLLNKFTGAVPIYVNTSRETLAALRAENKDEFLASAGVVLVTDTCTYVTAVMRGVSGAVMTNSGKWAHYAPANIGCDVAFGSLADCVASAAAGRVVRSRR
ncbi:MAG: aconitase X [Flavobacteriaceae bacterium]